MAASWPCTALLAAVLCAQLDTLWGCRTFVAVQELSTVGEEPVNIDAALTWLQHCHRFDLSHAVPVRFTST